MLHYLKYPFIYNIIILLPNEKLFFIYYVNFTEKLKQQQQQQLINRYSISNEWL